MSLLEIKQSVADLPDAEKGDLAAWLLECLPPHDPEDASAEGIAEAVRRRDELDSGKVTPLSEAEFRAAIERERASWE